MKFLQATDTFRPIKTLDYLEQPLPGKRNPSIACS